MVKVIYSLIYMRTLLLLVDSTKTTQKIISKCIDLENRLHRLDKSSYLQCTKIAKLVWLELNASEDTVVNVEPIVCALYYSVEKELKKLKFKPTIIDRLYDKYYNTSDLELEHKSTDLAIAIWDKTQEIMLREIDVSVRSNNR